MATYTISQIRDLTDIRSTSLALFVSLLASMKVGDVIDLPFAKIICLAEDVFKIDAKLPEELREFENEMIDSEVVDEQEKEVN